MKPVDTNHALAHVLVCVNERTDSEFPCCADGAAAQIYDIFHRWLDDHSLLTRIWLTRTECMGWCHLDGATIAIYPEDVWYRAVTPDDCQTLIDRHLQPLLGVAGRR